MDEAGHSSPVEMPIQTNSSMLQIVHEPKQTKPQRGLISQTAIGAAGLAATVAEPRI
jgi:hypothetical protein